MSNEEFIPKLIDTTLKMFRYSNAVHKDWKKATNYPDVLWYYYHHRRISECGVFPCGDINKNESEAEHIEHCEYCRCLLDAIKAFENLVPIPEVIINQTQEQI